VLVDFRDDIEGGHGGAFLSGGRRRGFYPCCMAGNGTCTASNTRWPVQYRLIRRAP
jgi:hypothetical protein